MQLYVHEAYIIFTQFPSGLPAALHIHFYHYANMSKRTRKPSLKFVENLETEELIRYLKQCHYISLLSGC